MTAARFFFFGNCRSPCSVSLIASGARTSTAPLGAGDMVPPGIARKLLRARERGDHPARVWVLYGEDYGKASAPAIAVGTDYAPGRYDWSVLAGVPVHIALRADTEYGLRLAAEIGELAATVILHWISDPDEYLTQRRQFGQVELSEAMAAERDRLGSWPEYWSEQYQNGYITRREQYRAALILDVEHSSRGIF